MQPISNTYLAVSRERRMPLVRVIIAFSLAIMLLNTAIVMKRALDTHHTAIEEGKAATEQLTRTITEHIELTFLTADQTLRRAVERQYFNALFGNNLAQDMQNNLQNWADETPQVSAMFMADETGEIRAIYRKTPFKTWLDSRVNVHQQHFFGVHEKSDNPDLLYVGWYASFLQEHDGLVVMSRRINKLDGSFGGIVLAAVNSDYVNNFFSAIIGSKGHRLILMRDDKQLLINGLEENKETERLYDVVRSYDIFALNALTSTNVIARNSFDTDLRIYAFRRIPNLDMVVTVVSFADDIFATWWQQRVNDVIFLAIFGLFVVVISFFGIAVAKQMRRVQRSERAAVLASQAKSDFLANMSHELRTPLNAIIGFSEMMLAGYFGKLNAKQKERIRDVNACGNHLLSLINDILEFSKGEAGKIELRNEEVSLPKVIRDVIRILGDKARREGLKLTACLPQATPLIMADERKIKQILLNLISNSLKFTPSGGIIEVTCGVAESGDFFFAVTDTGKGMKESEIPKALSAFGQVHSDPAKGGTGLGLPLCKMFAELHGGELVIQSIEGVGTKVTITLPKERILFSSIVSENGKTLLETGAPDSLSDSPRGEENQAG